MGSQTASVSRGWSESPTAWFCSLERALRTGDADLEALALRELARLGVHVAITGSITEQEVRRVAS